MFFTLSKIFWVFAVPSHLLVFFTAFCLIGLTWRKAGAAWQRIARKGAVVIVILYAALLVLPVGDWVIFPLESKAPPAMNLPSRIDGIVVLGAALDENITNYHGMVAMNGQAERLAYVVPLVKKYPKATVVYAGGSPYGNAQTEADLAKIVFQMWGLNTRNFVFERDSRNTYENIANAKKLVNPNDDQNWLLITSANHMPRAMAVARNMQWEMIPYPVDYVSGGWSGLSGSSVRYNMERIDRAVQEYIGMIAYRLSGKA